MWKYTTRRFLLLIPLMWAVATVVFFGLHLTPGDPITEMLGEIGATPQMEEEIRAKFGLDKPLHIQYGKFLWDAARLDFGKSIHTRVPVIEEIISRFPATMQLAFAAMGVTLVVGLTFGILAARARSRFFQFLFMVVALLGISTPNFWLGLILILVFGVLLGWLPVVGSSSTTGLILPALALGFSSGGLLARLVRSTMLEVTSEDYIRTAYAKGLRERVVVLRHALRNALIPVVTVSGMLFGGLLGGSVIIETVFARGGLGSLIILAINLRDIPVVVGVIMFFALIVVLTNLVVDLTYGFLDPRIRHQ